MKGRVIPYYFWLICLSWGLCSYDTASGETRVIPAKQESNHLLAVSSFQTSNPVPGKQQRFARYQHFTTVTASVPVFLCSEEDYSIEAPAFPVLKRQIVPGLYRTLSHFPHLFPSHYFW